MKFKKGSYIKITGRNGIEKITAVRETEYGEPEYYIEYYDKSEGWHGVDHIDKYYKLATPLSIILDYKVENEI